MKKLTFAAMFLLCACNSAPTGGSAQAASTPSASCCGGGGGGGCSDAVAPDASGKASGSCCSEAKQ